MGKFTKFMLTFALLVAGVGGVNATKLYATYGTPAGNGSWNAGTGVYTWTASSNNLMDLFTFGAGELANYKSLKFSTSGYTDTYRVCFMNGSTALATIAFYSAGDKDLVFSTRDETKNLDLSQITSIKFGGSTGSGSITITKKPYLEKPTEFKFDDFGKAYLYPSDLSATSWGVDSFSDETGEVVKSTEGYGGLSFDFGESGYDFSNITNIEISIDGNQDDIREYATVKDLNGHTEYISGTGGAYSNGGSIDSNIKTWYLGFYQKLGTMKINYVCFTSNMISCVGAGETVLKTLPWIEISSGNSATPDWRMGVATDTYYGNYSGDATHYADLTSYSELRIYRNNDDAVRAFFIKADGSGTNQVYGTWNAKGKYMSINLKTVDKYNGMVALKAIKASAGVSNLSVNNITVYKVPASNAPQYNLYGQGVLSSSATAALADANATSIDATGITAATALPTANPNCLIKANAGMVTNANNVIVDDVCENLMLTDEKPFKAPVAFTATNALFEKTVTAAGYATLVLPFNADVADGVEAYNIESESAGVLTTTVAEAIVANKPVMIKAVDASYSFKADDVAVPATPAGAQQNGLLYGVYETTDVPTSNGYVLQKHDTEVNFYKAAASQKVNAFRAYLATAAGARELSFDFNTTGVNGVKMNSEKAEVYNLNGQRVAAPQKGLYIVGGKKVIVK